VEVEADTIEQAIEASAAGADYVLFDNMDDATLAVAVQAVRAACTPGHGCVTEASGGVTFDRLAALAATGVDRVSTSKLTLAPPLDIALDADE
jgi:nicotinate-nucleotide pyrophosphorylase (carboxylating)